MGGGEAVVGAAKHRAAVDGGSTELDCVSSLGGLRTKDETGQRAGCFSAQLRPLTSSPARLGCLGRILLFMGYDIEVKLRLLPGTLASMGCFPGPAIVVTLPGAYYSLSVYMGISEIARSFPKLAVLGLLPLLSMSSFSQLLPICFALCSSPLCNTYFWGWI